jgi:phytoene desaturase
VRIVVIGAGIAGLATSALLARQGHDVTVVEKNDALGGRAGSWEKDGFRFDTGPSWYLMPEVFDHFYRLLGTSAEEQLRLRKLDPGYRVYFEGHEQPLDIAASREENVALFERVEKGAGARLERYLDSARDTYALAIKYFLYTTFVDKRRVFTREVLAKGRRFVRLLRRPLWTLAAETVADNRLRQILGYPAVFLGASPFRTPSLYHLMTHLDMADGVYYPMGGFARVIESIADLARAEGVEIRTGTEVQRILVDGGRARGVATAEGEIEADVVVSAADLHHTETQLLPAHARTYDEDYWRRGTPGPSALLMYLGVTGELPELEHHTLLFSEDWKQGFSAIFPPPGRRGAEWIARLPELPSLYVCKPSGVDAATAPAGSTNLFVLVPIAADPNLGSRGDPAIEDLGDRVVEQIGEWAGIPDLAERVVVRRTVGPGDFVDDFHSWRGTALGPAHTLRQSAFWRAGNASKKVDSLYYAGGSTIPGIGLPMCLISAELVVKRLLGDTSAGPLAEPLPRARP